MARGVLTAALCAVVLIGSALPSAAQTTDARTKKRVQQFPVGGAMTNPSANPFDRPLSNVPPATSTINPQQGYVRAAPGASLGR